MAKFMFRVEATSEAIGGVISEGAPERASAMEAVVTSLGGTFEGYYLVAGTGNVAVMFADFPDPDQAAALALAVTASGVGPMRYEQLLSPDDIKRSVGRLPAYRAPGAKAAFDPWA